MAAVLESLLFNLQTISKIPRGKRISTVKEFITVEDDSTMQGIWRWKNSDSRARAISAICREVRTTILLAHYISESTHLFNDEETEPAPDIAIVDAPTRQIRLRDLKKTRTALLAAIPGIDNICQTYENDADVSGHLRPLIGEINDCVVSVTRTLMCAGAHCGGDMFGV